MAARRSLLSGTRLLRFLRVPIACRGIPLCLPCEASSRGDWPRSCSPCQTPQSYAGCNLRALSRGNTSTRRCDTWRNSAHTARPISVVSRMLCRATLLYYPPINNKDRSSTHASQSCINGFGRIGRITFRAITEKYGTALMCTPSTICQTPRQRTPAEARFELRPLSRHRRSDGRRLRC
jgi:hypothetical protein